MSHSSSDSSVSEPVDFLARAHELLASPPSSSVASRSASSSNGRTPRLMISQLTVENFKSYAGEAVIGPFHSRFSSVVGPNGSGNNNHNNHNNPNNKINQTDEYHTIRH
jgi:hypothetical protein